MHFDLASWLRVSAHQVRHSRGPGAIMLAVWQAVSLPVVHAFLAIDVIVRPEIRAVRVKAPVFICGNPRSGTTLFQRLLAADDENACYRTWELALPSPTLRAMIPSRLHDWAANVVRKRFAALEAIHPVALDQPEEDELLFMLLGTSGLYQILFPHGAALEGLGAGRPWTWPRARRDAHVAFLHACIQRLLWARGASRYVSKSPHFSGRIPELLRAYPDARFVYLVRSPLEAVPSALSMARTMWAQSLRGAPEPAGATLAMYRTLVGLYAEASGHLDEIPPENLVVLHYADLIADPVGAVRRVYDQFGFRIAPQFVLNLRAEGAKHSRYRSRHRYTLEDFGLTEERVRDDLEFVFRRFSLDEAEQLAVASE